METTCKDGATRATMTRQGDKTFLMQAEGMRRGEPYSMKARYTYEGAQCTQSGIDFGVDKNSPECQKARAQISSMNPGTMCANSRRQPRDVRAERGAHESPAREYVQVTAHPRRHRN
jgi:hypothetical protein